MSSDQLHFRRRFGGDGSEWEYEIRDCTVLAPFVHQIFAKYGPFPEIVTYYGGHERSWNAWFRLKQGVSFRSAGLIAGAICAMEEKALVGYLRGLEQIYQAKNKP